MGLFQFKTAQHIPASLDEVWQFMSSPRNLAKITPRSMGFEITNEPIADTMYPGMIISYKVKPLLGIPMRWVTEITHVVDKSYFVDEQRIGPYQIWHHQHHLKETSEGVLMEDIVSYSPPLGFLGTIANSLFIKSKLEAIFNFRYEAVESQFGKSLPI